MSDSWIDINADLGESGESLANGTDFELMRFVTSANIACGGHAGDEHTMRETVRIAQQLNVAVGAHPGYPDRDNFGRIESPLSLAEIEATVRDQIAALAAIARPLGVELVHCKPHGALYHAANKSADVAAAIISQRVALSHAIIAGLTVAEFEPGGKAAAEIAALWREIERRLT